ncbi:hypothetical protein cypCar_00023980 [Cyprinus carpio]|nr:hypothetical protein cypCar_00023980 [Cyprinus carpio]
MERCRADYEKAKEQERHRLEKEQRLEQQKRKEEEDEKRKKMLKKGKQNSITSVKEDRRRQEDDVDKKYKEKERTKAERSSQVKDECKREEERGEQENKENEENLITYVDCGGLANLQVLLLGRNQLMNIHGLDGAENLQILQLSHNNISRINLQNVCLNLQECTSLQELNLTGNPLQQESNWRSLLLETVPGLIKLNNEQTAAAAVPHKCPEQQWSFQALCQAQQERRDSLLQQQKLENSSAPSQHDAQLLAIGHQPDLLRFAVDQRYAHEYGDSCVTEDSTLAAAANSSSCSYSEASLSQGQSLEMRAAWRGCVLRKKLARALASAQITESDEDLEEVDMDEFIFDESPLPLPIQGSPKTASIFPLQPKHAWSDNEDPNPRLALFRSHSNHLLYLLGLALYHFSSR